MDETTIGNLASQLQNDPASLPWLAKVQVVQELVEALRGGNRPVGSLALLKLLAADSKWEVRKEVADNLHWLEDAEFPSFAAPLTEDENAFVAAAALKAIARRRRGMRQDVARTRELSRLERALAKLEQKSGSKEVQLARKLAERRYEELVGSTVHEMRGIVTALKENVEQLQRARKPAPAIEKYGPRLSEGVAFLEVLLTDLRTFSQIPSQERHTESVAHLIQQATNQVVDEFKGAGRDYSPVQIAFDVPDNLSLQVSRVEIVQALRNLIKNAYEAYMRDASSFSRGQVRVSAHLTEPDFVKIVIEDEGVGFNSKELAQVREFIPGRTSKKYIGTGFGLLIARRNILNHGGTLEIYPGKESGAQVVVSLPIESTPFDESFGSDY